MSASTPQRPHQLSTGRRTLIGIGAVAVPAVIAAAIFIPVQAVSAVDLPDKTPEQLLEFVADSDVDQLTATIEQTSELGIPDLGALTEGLTDRGSGPNADDAPDAADINDLIALATGSHTAKVYLDGERARLQVLDSLAERNVYLDGDAGVAWFVDSESQTATRLTVTGGDGLDRPDPAPMQTPESMLDDALAHLDETTEVTVGTDARVAGRDVYELVLEPRTADTLVGSVRFAIDGENGAVLAASVTARDQDQPAFSISFTDVSFSAPDASTLTFEPGPDTAVVEKQLVLPSAEELAQKQGDAEKDMTDAAAPTVHGEDWSTVVELPSRAGGPLEGLPAEQQALLDTITTPVDGGRVLETSLLTVMLTDDGRVLVGAVPAETLVATAER